MNKIEQITDTQLSKCTQLIEISLFNNKIKSTTGIKHLSNLRKLNLE